MPRPEPPLRYDDAVSTLLRQVEGARSPVSDGLYLNMVDMLAQNRPSTLGHQREAIFVALETLRRNGSRSTAQRAAEHAARLAHPMARDLATYLLGATRGSSRQWLSVLDLDAKDWSSILPLLDPADLTLLKARKDLEPSIAARLLPVANAQLLLPAPAPPLEGTPDPLPLTAANDLDPDELVPMAPPETEEQIQLLIDRINRFRADRSDRAAENADLFGATGDVDALPSPEETAPVFLLADPLPEVPPVAAMAKAPESLALDWRFETGRDGCFLRAAAGPMSDVAMAAGLPSLAGQYLEDWLAASPDRAQAASAMARRAAVRDVRLHIPDGPLAGDWIIQAIPAFETGSGTFMGYRGTAVRQQALLNPALLTADPLTQSSEALASLAHETRTPLNAIMGFTQLIDDQRFGPVSEGYRAQSAAILDASSRLLQALDDVAEISRLDRNAAVLQASSVDAGAIAHAVARRFEPLLARRSVPLQLRADPELPRLWQDADLLERCLTRMVMLILSVCEPGEAMVLSVRGLPGDDIAFSLGRPRRLAGAAGDALLTDDSATKGTGFGIRFGLKLVQRFAAGLGGQLDIMPQRIELRLPALPALAALRQRIQSR